MAPQQFPTFQPMQPGMSGYPAPSMPATPFNPGMPWMPWMSNPVAMPPVNGLPVAGMTPSPMDPSTMGLPTAFPPMAPPPTPPPPPVPNANQMLDAGSWNVPAGSASQSLPSMQVTPIAGGVYHDLRQMGKQYGLPAMTAYGRDGMNGFPAPVAADGGGPRPLPPLPWEGQPTALDIYRQQQQPPRSHGPASPALARFPHLASFMGRFGR